MKILVPFLFKFVSSSSILLAFSVALIFGSLAMDMKLLFDPFRRYFIDLLDPFEILE